MNQRAAFSLLELSLAMAIFAVVIVAVLESMVNVSNYTGLAAKQGDLELQSQRIQECLTDDLGNSSWMVIYNSADKKYYREFPKVTKPLIPSEGYGDELVFLRLRTERRLDTTTQSFNPAPVSFAKDPATPMSQFAKAKPVTSMLLNPGWVKEKPLDPFVAAVWESATPSLMFSQAQDLTKLRQYRYIVKPDLDLTGRGILFREYRNGNTGSWTTDVRIADNIVSITYFTNKEQSWLNPNQIRILVEMKAEDLQTGKARAMRQFEMTVAMRSTINEQIE